MSKKFFALSLICCLIWIFLPNKNEKTKINNISNIKSFLKNEKNESDSYIESIISIINNNNDKIKSISCDNLLVKTDKRFIRLNGSLDYEKPNNIRIVVNSQLGKEIELGSNEEKIWFCSKRYMGGSLNYCLRSKINEASLNPVFNPSWLIMSLGYSDIPKNVFMKRNKDNIICLYKEKFDNCQVVILLDANTPRHIGSYLYNDFGDLIASSEVIKWDESGVHPYGWNFRSFKDDFCLEIELKNPKTNIGIPVSRWQLPSTNKMINMSDN